MKKGLTLVELMVSVSILAIGIILIGRSFLSVASAVSTTQNRVLGLLFLDRKMAEVEQKAREESGVASGSSQGEANINNHKMSWNLDINPTEAETEGLEEELNTVYLGLEWQEANRADKVELVTYLPNNKDSGP